MDLPSFLSVLFGTRHLTVTHLREEPHQTIDGLERLGFRYVGDRDCRAVDDIMSFDLLSMAFTLNYNLYGHHINGMPRQIWENHNFITYPCFAEVVGKFLSAHQSVYGDAYNFLSPRSATREWCMALTDLVYSLQNDTYLRYMSSSRDPYMTRRHILEELMNSHRRVPIYTHREHPMVESQTRHLYRHELEVAYFDEVVNFTTERLTNTVKVEFGENLRKFIRHYKTKSLICIILDSHADEIESEVFERIEISDKHFGLTTYNLRGIRSNGVKPAKAIKSLLDVKYPRCSAEETYLTYYRVTNKHLEEFANLVKSFQSEGDYDMRLLPASHIPAIYNESIIKTGRLVDSCMRGKGHLYKRMSNQDAVEILACYHQNGLLAGRALVWTAKRTNGTTIKVMDRVYSSKEYIDSIFLEYARANGIWRKLKYTSRGHRTRLVAPDGTVKSLKLKVKFDTEPKVTKWPFLDTFCFIGDGYLYNYEAKGVTELASCTDGSTNSVYWDVY